MKQLIYGPWGMLLFVVAVILVSLAYTQSRLGMAQGGLLSGCAISEAKELAFCNVANDPANPDGLYVSANGAAYFLVSKQVQGQQPTTINCSTWQASNSGLSASGCVLK